MKKRQQGRLIFAVRSRAKGKGQPVEWLVSALVYYKNGKVRRLRKPLDKFSDDILKPNVKHFVIVALCRRWIKKGGHCA